MAAWTKMWSKNPNLSPILTYNHPPPKPKLELLAELEIGFSHLVASNQPPPPLSIGASHREHRLQIWSSQITPYPKPRVELNLSWRTLTLQRLRCTQLSRFLPLISDRQQWQFGSSNSTEPLLYGHYSGQAHTIFRPVILVTPHTRV